MTERREILGWNKEKYSEVVSRLISKGVIEKVRVPVGKGRPLVSYQLKGKRPSVKHGYYVYWIVNELVNKGLVCRVSKVGEEKPDIESARLLPLRGRFLLTELFVNSIQPLLRILVSINS